MLRLPQEIAAKYGCLSEDDGIAFRGTYLITPEGILEHITMNNFPIGRNIDETKRVLQAVQFVAEHGEVRQLSTHYLAPPPGVSTPNTEGKTLICQGMQSVRVRKFLDVKHSEALRAYNAALLRPLQSCLQLDSRNQLSMTGRR